MSEDSSSGFADQPNRKIVGKISIVTPKIIRRRFWNCPECGDRMVIISCIVGEPPGRETLRLLSLK
ncbi:MAG: hypothetical protein ACTSRU_05405, partial [Candidatus Hodarchaeales archaeon]